MTDENLKSTLKSALKVPRGAENVVLFIYKGWNSGGIQRARFQYIEKNKIVSYFLRITKDDVEIDLPSGEIAHLSALSA